MCSIIVYWIILMFQVVPSLGICGKFLYGLQCFSPAVFFVLFNSHQ